ncbi:amino acid ABC transporter permease [Pannus brasiliensis CCIBt3594]|uniref:Amino acid ABC transporter permease n=1 Tax=Pannus brasiliensis CCIBt3594 TaxID=1427578 RepID=A0AAW9QV80_9CHRO
MGLLWLKKNLFNTWYNAILTVVSLLAISWFGRNFLVWAFTRARWAVIGDNLRLFFVGRYPEALSWRIGVIIAIILVLGVFSLGISLDRFPRFWQKFKPWLGFLWIGAFFPIWWLLLGGFALEPVSIDDLSGLVLTIVVSVSSIALCFPFGILLALGRQSELPAIRWLSTAYIEIVRGLPLIGILFLAQVMLPLILPSTVRPDRVVRAIAGFTIFAAAYLAENVRGGLQSIPRGQIEAARALGLNPILVLFLIVLPQALKAVIPAIVGQFISLFKDTSLLAIVGLVDLLGMAGSILANPKFVGRYAEVYLFVALIYWIFCYSMSIAGRRLEKRLNTGR